MTLQPLVAFKVLHLNPQLKIVRCGHHVNVFVSHPKLLLWISEPKLVLIPATIKAFSRFPIISTTLNHLKLFEV